MRLFVVLLPPPIVKVVEAWTWPRQYCKAMAPINKREHRLLLPFLMLQLPPLQLLSKPHCPCCRCCCCCCRERFIRRRLHLSRPSVLFIIETIIVGATSALLDVEG